MKYFAALGLALVMVFAVSAVTMAVPPISVQKGEGAVFADQDWWATNIGSGYGLTDNITVGAVYDVRYRTHGIFGNWELKPISVAAETWITPNSVLVTGEALWNVDLDPFTLGIGGGVDIGPGYIDPVLSAAASLDVGKQLVMYAGMRYLPSSTYQSPYCFKVGAALKF